MLKQPRLIDILDEPTCRTVHREALGILRGTGFKVNSERMRERLRAAGAIVEDGRNVVRLPEELVAAALRASPSELTMADLDGNTTRVAEGTAAETIGTYVEAISWLDFGAERLRPSRLEDLERALRLADALPLVRQVGVIVCPMDLPVERQFKESLRAILTTTRKALVFGVQNEQQMRLVCDALRVAAPDAACRAHPPAWFVASPTSPLVLDEDSADAMILGLERGLVPILAPCPMAGGSSPFSIMGTVLQQTVENLFMVVAKFAVKPDAPALWGGAGAPMDMRVGDVSYGAIERSLMMLANIDMARHFGIPCHSPAGSADSCLLDVQLGAEKTWTFMTRLASRAACGLGLGAVTNGKAVSLEQMLIDHELVACIKRFTRGIESDRLEIAATEIAAVGHGGSYLAADGTLELLRGREEYYYPTCFNRQGTNAPGVVERAHAEAERLLSEWQCPVPDRIRDDVEMLLRPGSNTI